MRAEHTKLQFASDPHHAAPGAVCSTDSTATLSTAGATSSFRAAFFTGAGLGVALATRRFAFPRADLTALRAFPRLAEFRPRSLARAFTFDPFLRLAMIAPLFWLVIARSHSVGSKGKRPTRQTINPELSTERGAFSGLSDWKCVQRHSLPPRLISISFGLWGRAAAVS